MSDPRRPSNLQHSQRIHPEGSVSTPGGETHSSNAGTRTIGRGASPSHPPSQRAIPWRATPRGWETEQRVSLKRGERFVFHTPKRPWEGSGHSTEECGVRSKGMCGRKACPWTSSNARSIENRVWKSRQRISSSPVRPLSATFGSTARRPRDLDSGRREGEVIFAWKRGSNSLSRA